MIFLRKLYVFWIGFVFITGFLLVFPWLIIFHYTHKYIINSYLHSFWAWWLYTFSGIRHRVIYKEKLSKHTAYIFCANHSSYLDIPTMALAMRGAYAFVGKYSLSQVPVFGYMFATLHIAVERESKLAAARSFLRMKKTIKAGKSLVIFPEGGIYTENPPEMVEFKEGAFRLAIETNTPLVPVTIKNTWKVLPDDGKFLASRHSITCIVHTPIATHELTQADAQSLKQQTFQTISQNLSLHSIEK